MAFTKMTEDVSNISKLDDAPNDTNGLTAAQLKAEFDKAGNQLKAFINQFINALEANGAESVGITPNTLIGSATNVQMALLQIAQKVQDTTLGAIPDRTITADKLVRKTITGEEIADGAVNDDHISDVAASKITGALDITHGGTGAYDATSAMRNLLAGGKTILSSNQYGDTLPAAGEEGQIFFLKVK